MVPNHAAAEPALFHAAKLAAVAHVPENAPDEFRTFYNLATQFSGVGSSPPPSVINAIVEAWRGKAGFGMASLVDGTVAKIKGMTTTTT